MIILCRQFVIKFHCVFNQHCNFLSLFIVIFVEKLNVAVESKKKQHSAGNKNKNCTIIKPFYYHRSNTVNFLRSQEYSVFTVKIAAAMLLFPKHLACRTGKLAAQGAKRERATTRSALEWIAFRALPCLSVRSTAYQMVKVLSFGPRRSSFPVKKFHSLVTQIYYRY